MATPAAIRTTDPHSAESDVSGRLSARVRGAGTPAFEVMAERAMRYRFPRPNTRIEEANGTNTRRRRA
jgi:hypothetical protein